MGCGESKHAIATENTISKSNRSNSKKIIEEKKPTKENVSGNVVSKENDNAGKVSAECNVKEAEKIDQILEEKDDQTTKVDEVKEASLADAAPSGDGNVKEAERAGQIVEKQGDQNVTENDDQTKGGPVVEIVKKDGDKEVAPGAKSVVDEAKGGEEKKVVKEENPIKSDEVAGAKEEKDAKFVQPDEAKKDEVVKEKESVKEIATEAKNDVVLEDQNEVKETGKAETVQSAEAKDSANNVEEKIPSAKEETEIESAEAEKKSD